MTVDLGGGYLSGLPEDQRDELIRVNAPGLAALRGYLSSGEAVAFLGAGVSRPLYPLWDGLIGELLDAASGRLSSKEEATCRALAHDSPEAIVEIVRRGLGPGVFREVLRGVLKVRTDPETGRSWTPVQEKAGALHARLVPPDLDPDPLATVERLVAEAEEATDEDEGDH